MRQIWLVTTEHLEKRLWFLDEEDFRVGMNYVAIQAHYGKVSVLSFILMSNHVHFILKGRRDDALGFVDAFKHRYSGYYRHKYGVREFLRSNAVHLKGVGTEEEAFERALAYVQVNCVAAGICAHPSQYPWGTGNVFFSASTPSGKPLGSLSKRAVKRILHSDCQTLPATWLISDDGYILPHNYVDIKSVEAHFRSPQRMNYFLQSSSKAKKRLEAAEEHLPAFRDQTILATLPELCRSLFGKNAYTDLSEKDQTELVRQIRYRFSACVHQIARVCGITYQEAARRIDGV